MNNYETKKSIQEIILDFLHGKKAIKQKKLNKKVEVFIENSNYTYGKTKPKYLIKRTLKKMIQDKLIDKKETNFSSFLSITSAGRNKLRHIKLSSQYHLVSTDWDGYWRIIIVDIPDNRKKERDALRYILKKAHFIQIKSSLWISPFPMEHMMVVMKDDMNLNDELMIFITDKLDTKTERLLEKKFIEAGTKEKES